VKFHRHTARLVFRSIALAVALGMSGGHWMLLQSVAWTRMIVEYSRRATLETALEETFDGRHPCSMCRLIEAARQASQPPHAQIRTSVVPDDDAIFTASFDLENEPSAVPMITLAVAPPPARRDPPPLPPPRLRPG